MGHVGLRRCIARARRRSDTVEQHHRRRLHPSKAHQWCARATRRAEDAADTARRRHRARMRARLQMLRGRRTSRHSAASVARRHSNGRPGHRFMTWRRHGPPSLKGQHGHAQTDDRPDELLRQETRPAIKTAIGTAGSPAIGCAVVPSLLPEMNLAAPRWANGAPERRPATTFYRGNSEAPIKYASTACAH
jgi:hypothetical protein